MKSNRRLTGLMTCRGLLSATGWLPIAALAATVSGCTGAEFNGEEVLGGDVASESSALVPGQIDTIRVQAVLVADDDGSNGVTVTAAQIRDELATQTVTFQSANIRFTFDPQTDLARINSTLLERDCTLAPGAVLGTTTAPACDFAPHEAERVRVAQTYPGKLVVYFAQHFTIQTTPSPAGDIWQYAPNYTNFSGGTTPYVHMSDSASGLGHEMGHYLNLDHPWRDLRYGPPFLANAWVTSVEDTVDASGVVVPGAKTAIKRFVESQNLPKARGYDIFDGDGLASTPPDPLPPVFESAGLNPCNPNQGTLIIPVRFSDNSTFTYTFTPDRNNVESYWQQTTAQVPCRGTPSDISSDQVTRVRNTLETGVRTPLIAFKQQYTAVFEPNSTGQTRAIGWAVSDFATRFNQEIAAGKHFVHQQAYDIGGAQIRYDGVWENGARGTTRAIAWSIADFATRFNQEIAAGQHLVHMQAYDLGGGQIRYDGVWENGGANGTTRAIAWSITDFATRFNQEIAAGKHLVHMQAYDIGGAQIRYDGVWENGDRKTTRAIAWSLSDFETRFNQEIAAGKHLVHMQAYDVGGGQIRYDGVWETGAPGTRHLFAANLVNFSLRNEQEVAAGRRLVHLDEYDVGNGQLRYDGVWEPSSKVQTHIFSESQAQFAAGFNAQLAAGKHAVIMDSIRGR